MDIFDLSNSQALPFVIAAAACAVITIPFAIRELVAELRDRVEHKSQASIDHLADVLETAEIAVVQMGNTVASNKWVRDHAKVTRLGDKRFRGGKLGDVVPPLL